MMAPNKEYIKNHTVAALERWQLEHINQLQIVPKPCLYQRQNTLGGWQAFQENCLVGYALGLCKFFLGIYMIADMYCYALQTSKYFKCSPTWNPDSAHKLHGAYFPVGSGGLGPGTHPASHMAHSPFKSP